MRDYHLALQVDSEEIILRSVGDEEPEPVTLSGSVVLDLQERTHISDILLVFNGRAHISYTDTVTYKTHNFEIPVFHHDQSFLPSFHGLSGATTPSRPGSSAGDSRRDSFAAHIGDSSGTSPVSGSLGTERSSASSSSANLSAMNHSAHASSARPYHTHGHHSSHTLNAGMHKFPFAITIPSSLPASLRVGGLNTSSISYQLKVTVQKSGVFGGKRSVKRPIMVIRSLSPESAEYTQTLEVDNTWPNKIMYNFTLPQKAYCAGESIPIALKFTPISKGVRVTQLVTNIKEHVTVLSKNSQPFNTTRDIVTKKHNFVPRSSLWNNGAGQADTFHGSQAESSNAGRSNQGSLNPSRAHPVSVPPSRSGSHTDLAGMAHPLNRLNLDDHPMLSASGSSSTNPSQYAGTSNGHTPASGQSSASHSRGGSRAASPERIYYGRHQGDPDFVGLVDEEAGEEVDVDAVIEIPIPLSIAPSHSLEPILVSHKIKWSAFIKNLDGHTSELRCALPIYILSPLLSEEARLASSGTRSLLFGPSGVLVPAAEGIQQVDLPSYADHVRDRVANLETATANASLAAPNTNQNAVSTNTSFVRSPWATPGPTSPEHYSAEHLNSPTSYFPTRPINWADSELLSSLAISSPTESHHSHHQSRTSSSHGSPATSRPGSRPGSRGGSRANSRPASRASSPVRGESTNEAATSSSIGRDAESRPSAPRSSSSGFFSHLPKPLRPFTGLGSSASSHSSSTNLNKHPMLQSEDRSFSAGSLSNFFGNAGHSRSSAARQHPDQVHSDNASMYSPGQSLHDATDGPRPDALQAALEAAQQKQDKGKKRAHFSMNTIKNKGKQRGGAFASMLHDDEDDDHEHDSETHGRASHSGAQTPAHERHHEHSIDAALAEASPDDETGTRILSQVPSYQVASRGFLGGVIPISAQQGLPSYDQSEALSRPGSPLQRTDTTATRSSTSTSSTR